MIEFGNVFYYIDIMALEKAIAIAGAKPNDKVTTTETKTVKDEKGKLIGTEILEITGDREREFDGSKYTLIMQMIEVLLDSREETEDDSLGSERALAKTSFAYKLAFNTLINYGILKEKE